MGDFYKGKCVLITGANGFLGSHQTIGLLNKGAQVIGIIKERPQFNFLKIGLKGIQTGKLKIIKSDIVNYKAILGIFKQFKPDVCLHLAAQAIIGIADSSPLPTFETNIKGTWNILEAARICNTKAVVVASTSSDKAYGEHRKLPYYYKEEAALSAMRPYDASKSCADILSGAYAHTYGLNTAVTRCANIYGPGDLNFSRIIPNTIRCAIQGENPVILSDGSPFRNYIYIKDAVHAYFLLAQKLYDQKIKRGEAFNFGTGKSISVLSLVNKILSIAKNPDLKAEILGKRKIKGEIDRQYLSSLKARTRLGWKCRYPLEKGLRETYIWYKKYLLSR